MATKKESDRAKILQQRITEDNARACEAKKAWEKANPDKFREQQKEAEVLRQNKEARQNESLRELMQPRKIREKESEISTPSQPTIRQYTKIYDLPLDQSLAHLNSMGFRCYADDELKIPVRTVLDGMCRNLHDSTKIHQQRTEESKWLQEEAEERKRKILAQVYERAEQQQKEALRRQKEAGAGASEAKREEALKLRRQEIADRNKSSNQEYHASAFSPMPQKEANNWNGGMKCNICGYLWDTRKRIGLPAKCPRCCASSIVKHWR